MSRWIWYIVAVGCMVAGFMLTPEFTWHYFVSVFLYALAGGLTWAHVTRPRIRRITPEQLREIDKEYRR